MTTRTASNDIEGLVKRLEDHVRDRGGMSRDETGALVLPNGAWAMMLEAATALRDIYEARMGAVVLPASSPAGGDVPTDLATRIMALDWKARKDWTVDEQADRHGEIQEMIDAALSPSLPAKGESFVASASCPHEPSNDGAAR